MGVYDPITVYISYIPPIVIIGKHVSVLHLVFFKEELFRKEIHIMFYVKTIISPDVEMKIDITDENVFCRCPRCGVEVPVDLSLFATDEDFEINSSAVLCEDCTKEFLMEVNDHE